MTDFIRFEASGAVATMTLARPDKLNAISDDMLHAMLKCLARMARDPSMRALIVTGEGRAFSAGGDIAGMDSMDEPAFIENIHLYMRLAQAFRDLDKITIAAINGYALAGGFELAMMCDIRISAASAVFGLPDAALGLSPTSGMTWMLPRIIGYGRAMHLTLTGDQIDASEAERIGLVTSVVEDALLVEAALELAERFSGYPAPVSAKIKSGFLDALEGDYMSAMRLEERAELECFRSDETRQAFAEFLNRKKG